MSDAAYNEAVESLRALRQRRDALPLVPEGEDRRRARELEDQAIAVLRDVNEQVEDGALEAARESLNTRWLFALLLERAVETLPG